MADNLKILKPKNKEYIEGSGKFLFHLFKCIKCFPSKTADTLTSSLYIL